MDESKQSESEFLCIDKKITVDSLIMDGTIGDDERTETERNPSKTKETSSGCRDLLSLSDTIKEFESIERGKGKRPKRRQSKKSRHWKPYYKLTWKERGELEDRETMRANRKRAERFAQGQPAAPYNTTQFLIEDHNAKEPNLGSNHRQHRDGSVSSDDYYSSPEDEMSFMEKEFSEEYERSHAERLHSMSKPELVAEYVLMESRVEEMDKICAKYSKQNELRSVIKCDRQTSSEDLLPPTTDNPNELIRLRLLVEKLTAENEVLRSHHQTESLLKVSSSAVEDLGET